MVPLVKMSPYGESPYGESKDNRQHLCMISLHNCQNASIGTYSLKYAHGTAASSQKHSGLRLGAQVPDVSQNQK